MPTIKTIKKSKQHEPFLIPTKGRRERIIIKLFFVFSNEEGEKEKRATFSRPSEAEKERMKNTRTTFHDTNRRKKK